jgi:hypothetical protein
VKIPIILEAGSKRYFASALDWPGWARGGKSEDQAVEALIAYAPRYAAVAKRAGLRFGAERSLSEIEVVERVHGGGGTDFGVPSIAAKDEAPAVSASDLRRLIALMKAAWTTFDDAAAGAEGVTLSLGPRGGGRPLDKIRDHVRDAEIAYIGQLGAKTPDPDSERETFLEILQAVAQGKELAYPRKTKNPWSPRYAVRRAAWHVLDHAWEIEDRSRPAP